MSESVRMQQIRKMLLTDAEDDFLNYALALELEKEGKPQEAIDVIEHLILRNPAYSGAYYKLGGLLEQTGQKEKAITVYLKGIKITARQKNEKALRELREALQNAEEE